MALNVGELFATVSLDDSGFQSTLGTLTKSIGKFIGITSLFTLGKESIESYAEFESAFTGVMKTVDETANTTYEDIKASIIGMAEVLPATTTEIAGVMEAAGQLGISADYIEDFTRTMIDMGESTNLSAEDAATTLARFANIMGTSHDEFSNLGSAIVDLGNNYATTEREIAEMALRMAGAGRQAGMTEAEILGIATAMSSVGLYAEAGGTAFSTFISSMGAASSIGAEEMAQYAKAAGMTADAFKDLYDSDPAAAFTAFIKGLGEMEDASTFLYQMGIDQIRMRDMLLRTSGAADMLAGAIDTANTAYEENIALTIEAEKRYATLDSQFDTTKNNLKDLFRQFGEELLPAVNLSLDAANALIDGVNTIFNQISSGDFGGAIDTITGYAEAIADTFTNFFADVDWEAVGTQLSDFAISMLESLASAFSNADGGSIVNSIGEAIIAALDALSTVASAFVRSFLTWLITDGGWKTLGTALIDIFISAVTFAWEAVKSVVEGLGDIIVSLLTPGIHAAGFDVDFAITPHLQMMGMEGEINMIIADIESMLDDGLSQEEVTAAIENIQFDYGLNNEAMQSLEEAGFFDALQTAVNNYFGAGAQVDVPVDANIVESEETASAGGTIEEIQQYYEQELQTEPIAIQAEVTVDQAVTLSEEAVTQFGEAGTQAGQIMSTNVATAIANTEGITGAINALASAAGAAASTSMKNAGVNAGNMFCAGIAQGIRNGESIITSAARRVAKAAIAAANATLQIRSPSRVMMESGGYFSEGFAKGIMTAAKSAVSAASGMASMAANAATIRRPVGGLAIGGAAAYGGGAVIDYDRMAEAMSNYQMVMDMDGKRVAQINARNAERAQNKRQHSLALGYGINRR